MYGYKKYFAQRKIGIRITFPSFLIRNCIMFSVLRSPFSVLRSPFSVLRSPFSVLLVACLMLGGCATSDMQFVRQGSGDMELSMKQKVEKYDFMPQRAVFSRTHEAVVPQQTQQRMPVRAAGQGQGQRDSTMVRAMKDTVSRLRPEYEMACTKAGGRFQAAATDLDFEELLSLHNVPDYIRITDLTSDWYIDMSSITRTEAIGGGTDATCNFPARDGQSAQRMTLAATSYRKETPILLTLLFKVPPIRNYYELFIVARNENDVKATKAAVESHPVYKAEKAAIVAWEAASEKMRKSLKVGDSVNHFVWGEDPSVASGSTLGAVGSGTMATGTPAKGRANWIWMSGLVVEIRPPLVSVQFRVKGQFQKELQWVELEELHAAVPELLFCDGGLRDPYKYKDKNVRGRGGCFPKP
jgi:hypothetical protein